MEEKIIIKDSQQYKKLLEKFQSALTDKIPSHEKPSVRFTREPATVFEFGPASVIAELETNSSGCDRYIVYLNNKGEAEFIRLVNREEGDKL
jgi:hypothetical protein